MNKYRDKSDVEINKAVAVARGYKVMSCEESVMAYIDSGYKPFDPCNHPYDAMPIVFENNISLHAPRFSEGWMAEYTGSDDDVNDGFQADYFDSHNQNPLRAAMEVFLMMKDTENE
ncbi:phage protein NinX family protein [Morganella morganii]|uniref:phage protein NinX family protein n=1 Tax=Morganella morganii TaxID=582 RepID=UPI002368C68E|nr:phage protein NinX family protein [Morganella morganii]